MKKLIILVYGTACYVGFLAAFSYLIGFVSGFVVPTTVDAGGDVAQGWQGAAVNVALLLLFAVQHTIMARRGFKAWLLRFVHPAVERATFVLATCCVFALLFWQWRPMPSVVWSVDAAVPQGILWAIAAMGWGIVLLSSFQVNHFDLFGLRQTWLGFRGRPITPVSFVVRGLYRHVRHPLMLGILIAIWATPYMTLGHVVLSVGMTMYIAVGLTFEERGLLAEHPRDYAAYMARTPSVLPGLRRQRRAALARAE